MDPHGRGGAVAVCGRFLAARATRSRLLLRAGARVFHFDVGDGHFVEPVTVGPIVLAVDRADWCIARAECSTAI